MAFIVQSLTEQEPVFLPLSRVWTICLLITAISGAWLPLVNLGGNSAPPLLSSLLVARSFRPPTGLSCVDHHSNLTLVQFFKCQPILGLRKFPCSNIFILRAFGKQSLFLDLESFHFTSPKSNFYWHLFISGSVSQYWNLDSFLAQHSILRAFGKQSLFFYLEGFHIIPTNPNISWHLIILFLSVSPVLGLKRKFPCSIFYT